MKFSQGNADELKEAFWHAMADSPFVMLQLHADASTAVPMTVQLDRNTTRSIWFFTQRTSSFAQLGSATATFAAKGHDLFARFDGVLTVETSKERLDHLWSNFAEAWFDGGKSDPELLFLRLDLGSAEIWNGDLGLLNTAKMALGINVDEEAARQHVDVTL